MSGTRYAAGAAVNLLVAVAILVAACMLGAATRHGIDLLDANGNVAGTIR